MTVSASAASVIEKTSIFFRVTEVVHRMPDFNFFTLSTEEYVAIFVAMTLYSNGV